MGRQQAISVVVSLHATGEATLQLHIFLPVFLLSTLFTNIIGALYPCWLKYEPPFHPLPVVVF